MVGFPRLCDGSIQDDARPGNDLIEKIEVAPVACQQVTAGRRRLQKQQGVVEQGDRMGLARKPRDHACQHTGLSEHAGGGRAEAMLRDIVDCPSQRLEDRRGAFVGRIERAHQVGHLGKRHAGMIDDPVFQQTVYFNRCLALKHINIDARVEQKLAAYDSCLVNKRQCLFGSSRQPGTRSLRPDPAQRGLAIKSQAQYPQGSCPFGALAWLRNHPQAPLWRAHIRQDRWSRRCRCASWRDR